MTSDNLQFRIAVSSDQKKDILRAIQEQKEIEKIKDSDLSVSEHAGKSEFKDLYFEPITASVVGVYVFTVMVGSVSSYFVGRALDRFFNNKKPDNQVAQNPVVVVLLPDGGIENLDPRKIAELNEALKRIEEVE